MLRKSIECCRPRDIIFDSINQVLMVSSRTTENIYVYNKKKKLLGKVGSKGNKDMQFNYIDGLCLQPATNNIIVADSENNRIQVLSNSDGSYKNIQKLYTIGRTNISMDLGQFHHPTGVSCNKKGHIMVSDCYNERVQIFDEKGRYISNIGIGNKDPYDGKFNYPINVYVDKLDRINVVYLYHQKIGVWNSDGSQFIRSISFSDSPRCLTSDNQNRLIVGCDYSVHILDETYKVINMFGRRGKHIGEFLDIKGLCVTDENKLMLCDCFNNRIQTCDLSLKF